MENKFERQIHQKLDELKIPPSESVWLSVKHRIKYKKDRKWPVIILILLILIIPVGYYLFSPPTEGLITSTQPPKTNTAESNSNINNTTGKNEETARSHSDQVSDYLSDSKPGDKEKIDNSIHSSSSIDGKSSDGPNSSNNNRERKVASIKSKDYSINADDRNQINEKLVVAPKPESAENFQRKEVTREEYREPDKSNTGIESQTYLHEVPDIKIDQTMLLNYSLINEIKQLTLSGKAITEISIAQRDVVENKVKKKLSVGIYVAGGLTHAGNRFLGLGTAQTADYSQSPNNNSGNSGGGTAIPGPSKVKNAFGYATGIFLEKEISKSSSISFGINFKELNTSNFVGRKNDSIPGSIYFDSRTSSVSQQYRNSFRFVELPLQVNTQLIKGNKITLLWHGGLTISQLISSNALQFDPALKSYYNDNSVFNKTQLGINTALSASVIKHKNLKIFAGPFINYHFTRIANEGLYAKNHFVFAGLQTRILFEKR
jgi:hypothetical protein